MRKLHWIFLITILTAIVSGVYITYIVTLNQDYPFQDINDFFVNSTIWLVIIAWLYFINIVLICFTQTKGWQVKVALILIAIFNFVGIFVFLIARNYFFKHVEKDYSTYRTCHIIGNLIIVLLPLFLLLVGFGGYFFWFDAYAHQEIHIHLLDQATNLKGGYILIWAINILCYFSIIYFLLLLNTPNTGLKVWALIPFFNIFCVNKMYQEGLHLALESELNEIYL